MAETASDLGSALRFHPLGWRNSERRGTGVSVYVCACGGGGYLPPIVCCHKYTKLTAYQLISIHDPSEIFSTRPRPPEPRILITVSMEETGGDGGRRERDRGRSN